MTTLYHYCSTESFCSIIRTGTIWLSSLMSSNDTQEGRLVSNTLIELAKEDGLLGYFFQQFQQSVLLTEYMYDGLGFCLSADGDLLSQWRGYADDATGLSISFSKEYLEKLGANKHGGTPIFTMGQIEYRAEEHRKLLAPTYRELRSLINEGALGIPPQNGLLTGPKSVEQIMAEVEQVGKANKALSSKLHELSPKLFLLKSDAFQEEREHRLVATRLKDMPWNCEYRASGKQIVPYRSVKLEALAMNPIVEIILAPKHQTHWTIIASMLATYGFSGVSVKQSKTTYR